MRLIVDVVLHNAQDLHAVEELLRADYVVLSVGRQSIRIDIAQEQQTALSQLAQQDVRIRDLDIVRSVKHF